MVSVIASAFHFLGENNGRALAGALRGVQVADTAARPQFRSTCSKTTLYIRDSFAPNYCSKEKLFLNDCERMPDYAFSSTLTTSMPL